LIALAAPLATAPAQLVSVKTVPIAEGDQFAFLPSTNAGMLATVAVYDSALDPFRNPAAAARLRNGFLFASPALYAMNHSAGQGSTLPVGALLKSGRTFGGFSLAVQSIGPDHNGDIFGEGDIALATSTVPGTAPQRDKTNRYAFAMLGQTLRPTLSIAASATYSHLGGIDGTELLYAGSAGVQQAGDLADVRVGLLQQWNRDRSLEVVALRDRFSMSHDISFVDRTWDPTTRSTKTTPRTEHDADASQSYGAQLQYRQAIADSGWHAGGVLLANRTRYSKAPTMGSMDVSREPLSSTAFNAGLGLSRTRGRNTAGVDALYEPIFGRTSQTGAPNDDRYRFNNAILRGGVSHRIPMKTPGSEIRFMAGMQLRAVHYGLDQTDSTGAVRHSAEHWNEWVHAGSMSLIAPSWEMHWLLKVRSGTGRPGTTGFNGLTGTQTTGLVPIRTLTEQVTITVPIR